MKEILETWQIHNTINLYLLAAISEEHLSANKNSKGRTVGEQWAHIHNVRLMWLQSGQPELLGDSCRRDCLQFSNRTARTHSI